MPRPVLRAPRRWRRTAQAKVAEKAASGAGDGDAAFERELRRDGVAPGDYALSLTPQRFVLLCDDVGLSDVCAPGQALACAKRARAARAATSPKQAPQRATFQSPLLKTTAAQRLRERAVAKRRQERTRETDTNLAFTLSSYRAAPRPRPPTATTPRLPKVKGLSFCEFVEALVSLGDAALAADAHLRSLYPSPPERCRAIFDVWCLADVCDEVAAQAPAPRRPRWRSSFAVRPA